MTTFDLLAAFAESIPAWHADAACATHGPELWYPEPNETAKEAKAICAGCPVQPQCLEHALERGEGEGVWGAASSRERRRVARVWAAREHDWTPGCGCVWCSTVNGLCDTSRRGASWVNGPNARHGMKSTYVRGGRCGLCCFRMSVAGQRLVAAGVDVPQWWWWWFRGRRGQCSGGGDQEGRALLWKAMILAYADLADGYSLGRQAA